MEVDKYILLVVGMIIASILLYPNSTYGSRYITGAGSFLSSGSIDFNTILTYIIMRLI